MLINQPNGKTQSRQRNLSGASGMSRLEFNLWLI
jgi:hypothetical protein